MKVQFYTILQKIDPVNRVFFINVDLVFSNISFSERASRSKHFRDQMKRWTLEVPGDSLVGFDENLRVVVKSAQNLNGSYAVLTVINPDLTS